ncbi:Hypothetical protein PENO1_111040 [Penicillium occitanis (nom. inval.)]|nr:Hypothetical protein PENO1_111040 [Penicillium occitanis (nom. inval.)]PCG88349.1 hypothetical protein PENOC_111380 [Penicillium occitanis (nom. inval.)]
MTLKYLISGATGGLGSRVLAHIAAHVPSSEYAAASSRESKRHYFEERGIAFRHADFNEPITLDAAFEDVENLFFVSMENFDNDWRVRQHKNVIEAAKRTGVKHVWYTSLSFGGLESDSKLGVQKAHLATEQLLQESGINYTAIREGLYAEIFPIFLGWYPESKKVYASNLGLITLTSRDDLAEANAKLMIRGGYNKETVLLTANEKIRESDILEIINKTTNRNVELIVLSPQEHVEMLKANDNRGKPQDYWDRVLGWHEGIAKGDAELSHPLLRELIGREPEAGSEAIRKVLLQEPNATWPEATGAPVAGIAKEDITYEAFWAL